MVSSTSDRSVSGSARPRLGRRFWVLWSASTLSNLGDGVGLIALPWLATQLTSDALLVSLLAVARRAPWLFFTLPAGVLIDRVDRRALMVRVSWIRAAAVALLWAAVLGGWVGLWLYAAVVLVIGATEVLFDSAAQTLVPALAEKPALERANGRLRASELVTNDFLGRPIGGFLLSLSLALPFAATAVMAVVSGLTLSFLPGSYRPTARSGGAGERSGGRPARFWAELAEGVRWSWNHPLIRSISLLVAVINAMYSAMLATQVLLIQEVFQLDAKGFGILMAIASLGGVLGTQATAALKARIGARRLMLVSLLGMGVSVGGVGATHSPLALGALYVATSFFVILWGLVTVSLRQSVVPNHLLGRVNSVTRFLSWGVTPLGMLMGGLAVNVAEPLLGRDLALRLPCLASGALYVALFAIASPVLRRAFEREESGR
jgi:MFS family permease